MAAAAAAAAGASILHTRSHPEPGLGLPLRLGLRLSTTEEATTTTRVEWIMASVGDECVRFPMKCNIYGMHTLFVTNWLWQHMAGGGGGRGRRDTVQEVLEEKKGKTCVGLMRLMAGIWNALHTNNFIYTVHTAYLPIETLATCPILLLFVHKKYYLYFNTQRCAAYNVLKAGSLRLLCIPKCVYAMLEDRCCFPLYRASQLLSAIKCKLARQLFFCSQ